VTAPDPGRRYSVIVTKRAKKDLAALDRKTARRVVDALLALETTPRPPGCKKLTGREAYRVRIGDYRAIYTVEDDLLVVEVIRVGHRRDVYR
jgi:mRNA interferase RelE/StbE